MTSTKTMDKIRPSDPEEDFFLAPVITFGIAGILAAGAVLNFLAASAPVLPVPANISSTLAGAAVIGVGFIFVAFIDGIDGTIPCLGKTGAPGICPFFWSKFSNIIHNA